MQAVPSSEHPLQPNGQAWSQLMLKSELFEVHNIRSKNDRAPDILSSLGNDVKLLKGVGRRSTSLPALACVLLSRSSSKGPS